MSGSDQFVAQSSTADRLATQGFIELPTRDLPCAHENFTELKLTGGRCRSSLASLKLEDYIAFACCNGAPLDKQIAKLATGLSLLNKHFFQLHSRNTPGTAQHFPEALTPAGRERQYVV